VSCRKRIGKFNPSILIVQRSNKWPQKGSAAQAKQRNPGMGGEALQQQKANYSSVVFIREGTAK